MSGTENFNDYPKHPGQTTPRPYYVEIPLETFETMSEELAELRKHELAWDLDKARIKELEAENESLKYSVATLDTDVAMMKRWRKVSEEKPEEGSLVLVADFRGSLPYYELATLLKTTSGSFVWNINSSDDCDFLDVFTHWMHLPKKPEYK